MAKRIKFSVRTLLAMTACVALSMYLVMPTIRARQFERVVLNGDAEMALSMLDDSIAKNDLFRIVLKRVCRAHRERNDFARRSVKPLRDLARLAPRFDKPNFSDLLRGRRVVWVRDDTQERGFERVVTYRVTGWTVNKGLKLEFQEMMPTLF